MVLLIYPAIQTPAEFLLHKLQGLELLLMRCRRTPCFTGIRPQQLTTLFMNDGNDYGCGRYWYCYWYWYPILTSLMSGHRTGSDTIDEPSKKRVRLAGTATATCSTASAVNPASSTRSQPEEVKPPATEHSVTESAEVELIEFSSTGETSTGSISEGLISARSTTEGLTSDKTVEVETAAPSPGNDEPAGSKSKCSNCSVLQNQNRILQNTIRTLQGHLSRQKNENRKYRRRSGSK